MSIPTTQRRWQVYWKAHGPDRYLHLGEIDAPLRSTAHLEACAMFGAESEAERRHIWVGEGVPWAGSPERVFGVHPDRTSRASGALSMWQVAQVKAYLLRRLGEDVLLGDICEHIGLAQRSRPYLVRAFKAAVGVPPYQWQKLQRIERAKALLRSTDLPVLTIAGLVGYTNHTAFSRMFKRVVGTCARSWRDQSRRPGLRQYR